MEDKSPVGHPRGVYSKADIDNLQSYPLTEEKKQYILGFWSKYLVFNPDSLRPALGLNQLHFNTKLAWIAFGVLLVSYFSGHNDLTDLALLFTKVGTWIVTVMVAMLGITYRNFANFPRIRKTQKGQAFINATIKAMRYENVSIDEFISFLLVKPDILQLWANKPRIMQIIHSIRSAVSTLLLWQFGYTKTAIAYFLVMFFFEYQKSRLVKAIDTQIETLSTI